MIVRALLAAVLTGIAAGIVTAALQLALVSPLILEAERHEMAAAETNQDEPNHDHGEWLPTGSAERMLYTLAADIVVAAGWSLILVALFALRDRPVGWRAGLLWGLAGFLATAAIPALSLPPELPGTDAGDRVIRQIAWIAIAGGSAVGLWLLAFGPRGWIKAGGGLLIALAAFAVPVPEFVAHAPAPPDLRAAFVWRALLAAFAMWLALGALAGFAFDRATARRHAA